VVDHDERNTARTKHAVELVDRGLCVLDVVDDAVRIDEVERCVVERQSVDGSADEAAFCAREGETPLGEPDRRLARVEADVLRAGPRELEPVGRDPAAGLEDVAAGPAVELRHLPDVRLERVAMPLDIVEELRRPGLRVGEAKPGLVGAPEVAHALKCKSAARPPSFE
jgi:hypothetical protein